MECDPSIKSIIISIDSEKNDYIIEDLDDSHLLIKDVMVAQLKARLEEVSACLPACLPGPWALLFLGVDDG